MKKFIFTPFKDAFADAESGFALVAVSIALAVSLMIIPFAYQTIDARYKALAVQKIEANELDAKKALREAKVSCIATKVCSAGPYCQDGTLVTFRNDKGKNAFGNSTELAFGDVRLRAVCRSGGGIQIQSRLANPDGSPKHDLRTNQESHWKTVDDSVVGSFWNCNATDAPLVIGVEPAPWWLFGGMQAQWDVDGSHEPFPVTVLDYNILLDMRNRAMAGQSTCATFEATGYYYDATADGKFNDNDIIPVRNYLIQSGENIPPL